MRPHRLVMKAFGPFAAETTVDFDSMGNHIYLISGDTGAGKTTIFDGIIYALYGTASGGGRSGLSTEAFHSDYAKQGNHRDEMRVGLVFSNAGKTFSVERRMYWGKRGDAQKAVKESALYENGSMIVSGKGREDKDDVTAKITELLGLNADQFRRIIMLAQGEFQKFLEAGSDERGEILGKLYDNRRHQDFQLRLKAANELLKKKEASLEENAQAQLGIFRFPEDISEEERQAIAADHPDLLSVMGKLLDRMKAADGSLREVIQEKTAQKTKLMERKTQGETQNSLLDELDKKRQQLAQMEEEKPRMEKLRQMAVLAASAEKVISAEKNKKDAETAWKAVLKQIGELEKTRARLAGQEEELRGLVDAAEKENRPRIDGLNARKNALSGVLHFYDDLDASARSHDEKKKKLKKAEEAARLAQETLAREKNRQEELEKELLRLKDAGDLAVAASERREEDLQGRKKKLNEIQKEIRNVQRLMEEQRQLQQALQRARQAALEAEAAHLRLNTAFVQGQAGLLAEEMRRDLEHSPTVRCPVCGAEHTAADAARFAEYRPDIPTQEKVREALQVWDSAKKEESGAESRYNGKQAECRAKKDTLLDMARELAGISDWTVLTDGSALDDEIARCEKQLTEARRDFAQADADREAKRTAEAEKEMADAKAAAAGVEAERALEAVRAAMTEESSAKISVENWKNQLAGFPETKKEAREEQNSLEEQILALQSQIDDLKARHVKCLQDQAENEGNLSWALSERSRREQAKKDAENMFEESLRKEKFEDEEAYRDALRPAGELLDSDTVPVWITEKQSELEAYDRRCSSLTAAAKQLEESAGGKERADVHALEEQISRMDGEIDRVIKEEHELHAKIQTDQSVYDRLTEIQEKRNRYRRAFSKLAPLAETANGRYLFSRFVLSDFFHRIVEQANLHLETMTDGEYCLVPKETGDGRKNMGLELKVLNTITGIERDTASLSGGQSFEASLSLALGLSDVAQMESASRIQIDSMFIDEGFGSLDSARLDKAIEVLQHLSGGKRQIGIISHVARLDECLPRKIHVIAGDRGSTVKIETDQ